MRARDKLNVWIDKIYNKEWMFIKSKREDGSLVPSFEDWFLMLCYLVYCERKKYPYVFDPSKMVLEFFTDAVNAANRVAKAQIRSNEETDMEETEVYEQEWEILRQKYAIPKRNKK